MGDYITLTEDEVIVVKTRLEAARDHRNELWAGISDPDCAVRMDKPAKWRSLIRGTYWIEKAGLGADPAVRRNINRILPKLSAKHDILTAGDTSFVVEPRDERFVGKEDSATALLATDWETLGIEEEVEAARWDSDVWPYGVVEVSWIFERDDEALVGERGDPVVPDTAEPMLLPDGTIVNLSDVGAQEYASPDEAEEAARRAEEAEDRLIWGEPDVDDPYVERFSPSNLFVDPNAQRWDLSDARYVFRRRYEPQESVRRNSRYRGAKDIVGTCYSVSDEETSAPNETAARDDRALVVLYDGYAWMWRKGRDVLLHIIVADGHDEPLLVEPYRYVKDNGKPMFRRNPYPFRVIPGIVVDNDTWMPESAVEQAASVQLQFDESAEQLNEHRRTSNRQWLIRDNVLTPESVKRIEAGEHNACIPCKQPPEEFLWPLPSQTIAPEVYKTLEPLDQEMSRQLGVSEFQEAVVSDKKMLATEINALQQSGGARISGAAKRYRRFRADIASCMLALYQKFGDRKRSFSAVTEDGRQRWGSVNALDLRGMRNETELEEIGIQYQVKVNVDNEQPKNKGSEMELWQKLLTELAPLANTPDPERPGEMMINLKALVRSALKRFDIKNLSDIVPPAPSPQEREAMLAKVQADQVAQIAAAQEATGQQPSAPAGAVFPGGMRS